MIKNIVLGFSLVIAIMCMIFGYMQSIEAEAQAAIAKQKERAALIAEEDALRQRDKAEYAEQQIKQLQSQLEECKRK